MTDLGPSITSASTSSPRWAGKQCMNTESDEVSDIKFLVIAYGASAFNFSLLTSSGSPIDIQTSV